MCEGRQLRLTEGGAIEPDRRTDLAKADVLEPDSLCTVNRDRASSRLVRMSRRIGARAVSFVATVNGCPRLSAAVHDTEKWPLDEPVFDADRGGVSMLVTTPALGISGGLCGAAGPAAPREWTVPRAPRHRETQRWCGPRTTAFHGSVGPTAPWE
ncbi:hypothetical protein GCM10009798_12900 [Nocardioides panacihumi]|uniref:Uncharacterized protein n=1 Tax=Nocardioides panacihumi TaxID=400774 RepID=A0ABN2QMD7_9ACTN